jgi:hypothetical protein
MYLKTLTQSLIATSTAVALVACGGSDSGSSYSAAGDNAIATSVKLSGPLTLSAVASDAATVDGTVAITDTMAMIPTAILDDFASRFPQLTAEEQFRRIYYSGGVAVAEVYGIEGESGDDDEGTEDDTDAEVDGGAEEGAGEDNDDGNDADASSNESGEAESIEVLAEYTASGNFLTSVTTTDDITLPAAVADALVLRYSGASFDEAELETDQDGNQTYVVEVEQSGVELEVTVDTAGSVLMVEEEIAESQVPPLALANFQQELDGLDSVEYEKTTDERSGTVTYEAEYEGDSESVSITSTDSGEIIAIEYEVEL